MTALLAPTAVLVRNSGELTASMGLLGAFLLLLASSMRLWRVAQAVLLPLLLLVPPVAIYGARIGASPGADVLASLRLTTAREIWELLADSGGLGWWLGGWVLFVALVAAFRPTVTAGLVWRRAFLITGLIYVSSGLLHYSFLREWIPLRPWVSQEVVLRTYPFSLLEPMTLVVMAAHTGPGPSVPVAVSLNEDGGVARTVVLVIGESARADHLHMNGYPRATTPHLESMGGVVSLPHVRSISDCTYTAVPALLKMLGAQVFLETSRGAGQPTLLDYFKAGGYSTAFVSMQETRLIDEAGVVSDHTLAVRALNPDSVTLDEMILPELRRILAKPGPRKFLVLQLQGSHFQYRQRYPVEFDVFSGSGGGRGQRLDAYDNSLLYTDWVLSEIIRELQKEAGESVLAYVSDHGENLWDDSRNLYQHCGQVTHFDTQVATFFWSWNLGAAEKWATLVRNRERYVGQEMVGSTLLDLAGIRPVKPARAFPESLAGDIHDVKTRYVLSDSGLQGMNKDGN